jgi:protein TonB
MPVNVRRFGTSVLLVLISLAAYVSAQTVPTSGDVMRDRISKAKAYIAVRNYNAAIYELENIRRESNDSAVQGVVNVLLMNSYLEQSDYKRAQDLLNEFYAAQKTNKPNSQANYFAVAGQIVSGARNRIERYRALGLNVADRTLPLEAVNDLEKMRETLELVVTQTKDVSRDKLKTADAMALLEEAANSRSMMARDDYDARRWKDEVGDAREQLTSSRSVVLNATDGATVAQADIPQAYPNAAAPALGTTAASVPVSKPADNKPVYTPAVETKTADSAPVFKPVPVETKPEQKPIVVSSAPAQKPLTPNVREEPKKAEEKVLTPNVNREGIQPVRQRVIAGAPVDAAGSPTAESDAAKASGPLDVGSLIAYATKQSQPIYPPAARTMRTSGVVKVEVTVDENGTVAEVQNAEGPGLLQSAAKDAVKKWKFRPFVRDGQPVKATGFVSFNFSL